MAVALDEVKQALDSLQSGFHDFKKTNDARLEALAKGGGTAELTEKLSHITADLDKAEKVNEQFRKEQELKAKSLEATINRIALGVGGTAAVSLEAKAQSESYARFLRAGDEKLSADERKVLVVSNDSTGGYLAPAEMAAEIIKAELLFSPVRELVSVQPTGAAEYLQPKRTGTAAATRHGETSQRSETQNPSWGMVRITSPELYAEGRVTWANLEDSAYNLEQVLAEEFGEQFGVKEGQEFVSGAGGNQMLGILDANAAGPGAPLAFTASGSAASITADSLITLQHAVKTAYARLGRWLLNRATLGKVRLLKDSQGRYLWEPAVAAGLPGAILGAPYTECPDMPDEGANAFPIAFGDFKRGYKMTDRIAIAITRDPYTLSNQGQVKFSARKRVGGQVVLGEAIRLLKCAA
jgi:HK97 family phage major capsid protein